MEYDLYSTTPLIIIVIKLAKSVLNSNTLLCPLGHNINIHSSLTWKPLISGH